ncbi:MAG: ATP-binding cassette subfamily B protein [Candidatus Saccharimonadales bacterium]|jgi:ATP-binding cassette subfamily B protein
MSTTRQTLNIYWQHARKYKKQLYIIYPLMVVAQLMEDFLQPLLVAGILTNIASNNLEALQNESIWLILAGVLMLEIVSHLIWNVVVRIFWTTQDSIMRDINMTAFNHLQTMSFRFFADRFAGSLVNQVNKLVGSFERLTDPLTWNVFKLIVSLVLTTIILLPKAPIVALTILAISAIFTPVIWFVRRRQVPLTTEWAASETRRTGQLADTISNIVAVKSFSNEQLEQSRMQDRVNEVHGNSMKTMKMNMRQELATGSIQRSINVSVIVLSVILAIRGSIEVGVIYLALIYTIGIMRRLWDLNNTFRNLARVFGDAWDMTEIMQIKPEVADPETPVKFTPSRGEIEFKDVVFGYKDDRSETALFDGVNLKIEPGQKIGLIGPSGGGKTTVTKLLLRFMDIQDGTISIDGQDISKVLQNDLRSSISYVPQEPLLFHRTLSENISYGKLGATQKEIELASRRAHAHEFTTQLSEGYDTLVGERGVKLSGGQKQRVAIARAMLKDSPILLLDEATSALDSESEQLIQDALWKLMEGRTALVIAHRLSTIQKMDRIIVLDEGKIVEDGKHSDLVKKKNGLYARLWAHQSGGFIE